VTQSNPILRSVAVLFATLLTSAAAVYQCFSERVVYFDEVGLHNPVYMYLHYGKMTFPAHEHFDAMFVHPPMHYWMVATLMRTGLSVYHAAGLVSVLFFLVFAIVVATSRFPFAIQISFLFGGFLGVFVWNEALVLRPDVVLTVAWLGGLAALETGRLDNWNPWRLAIGGALCATATAVHYPAVAAWIAVPIYGVWIWRTLDARTARIKLAWMFGGAALVGIPDLVLFLIPHLRAVLEFSLSVQGAAEGSAFSRHIEAYAYWRHWFPAIMQTRPVSAILSEPLFQWSVPAAFAAPALLAIFPSTRGVAVASLPHLLFLLFGAKHKQIGYSGYFAAEIALYMIASTSLVVQGIMWAIARIPGRWATTIGGIVVTGALAFAALYDVPAIAGTRVVPSRGVYDLEAGRAAGRQMLGRDAIVGTSSAGAWFTSGATSLYFVTPDILYPPDIECVDLKQYFSAFDALVVDPHQTWVTFNRQLVNITSAYLDKVLQLRGFFFADRRGRSESGVSYMAYSVESKQPLIGYGVRGQEVSRFQEDPEGDQVYLSALCPMTEVESYGVLDNTTLKLDFYTTFFRPISGNEDPRSAKDHTIPDAILTLIADQARFESAIRPNLKKCTVRDQIRGRITKVSLRSFVDDSEKTDQTIRFYPTYATLIAATQKPRRDGRAPGEVPKSCGSQADLAITKPAGFSSVVAGALPLDQIAVAYKLASIEGHGPYVVKTAPAQWAYAASIPFQLRPDPNQKLLVHVRARVLEGTIGIGILDSKANSFEVEQMVYPADHALNYYIPIPAPSSASVLIFRNTSATGTPSEIQVENTEVLSAAP
jgi:hypothetical protein